MELLHLIVTMAAITVLVNWIASIPVPHTTVDLPIFPFKCDKTLLLLITPLPLFQPD